MERRNGVQDKLDKLDARVAILETFLFGEHPPSFAKPSPLGAPGLQPPISAVNAAPGPGPAPPSAPRPSSPRFPSQDFSTVSPLSSFSRSSTGPPLRAQASSLWLDIRSATHEQDESLGDKWLDDLVSSPCKRQKMTYTKSELIEIGRSCPHPPKLSGQPPSRQLPQPRPQPPGPFKVGMESSSGEEMSISSCWQSPRREQLHRSLDLQINSKDGFSSSENLTMITSDSKRTVTRAIERTTSGKASANVPIVSPRSELQFGLLVQFPVEE